MWVETWIPTQREYEVWSGRRGLAVLDTILWPCLLVIAAPGMGIHLGNAAPAWLTAIFLLTTRRLLRAWRHNETYAFFTWRVAKIIAFGYGIVGIYWVMAKLSGTI